MSSPQNNFPKSSDGEINIITPENRTYTHPDTGYFLATHGFESGNVDTIPAGWTAWPRSAHVSVKSELGNHKRVLEFYDPSTVYESTAWNSFIGQSRGSIECWVRTSDVSQRYGIYLLEGWNNYKVILYIDNYELKYKDSTSIKTIIGGINSNRWYHLRIDFECSSGVYYGLDADEFYVTLDGTRYGPFEFNTPGNHVTEFYAGSDGLSSNVICYLDAVGYSWDPTYEIGDNLNEGLLLSFENSTNLNWSGYSLDGAPNKTIFGNLVIPFPANGTHAIQVFGNDSSGNSYKSNLRYFSIDSTLPHISILAPSQYSYFRWLAPYFQISTFGDNLNTTFYQVDDFTFFCEINQGRINQALWEECAEGLVVISFYVNNTIGNYSMAELNVYKDTIAPQISTSYSYEGEVYDWMAPYFNLNIYDVNLDLKWYTLNDDPTKHYFTGQNLGIEQELWGYLDDGIVNITLYATDKAGNGNSFEFHVIKDTFIVDPYYPSYLSIAIVGIVLLGIVIAIIVIILSKNSQSRTRMRHYEQNPYQYQSVQSNQYEPPVSKRMLKCPYCSYEDDIDGNYCPQCGARLK